MIIGNPVTSDVVAADPAYSKYADDLTPALISRYTMEVRASRDADALAAIKAVKADYGSGVSTLIRVYNASSLPLKFVCNHDWHGGLAGVPYDEEILNGQWSVVLHGGPRPGLVGSCGAVVYRAGDSDLFFGWESPIAGGNSVYVEVREPGHWPKVGSWSYMQNVLSNASQAARNSHRSLLLTAQVGQSYSSIVDYNVYHE